MNDEEINANAFMLAISAIDSSGLSVVERYQAILELAKSEL